MKKIILLLVLLTATIGSCERDKEDSTDDSGTFIDARDGQSYQWDRIGDQIWMAENLNASGYADGTAIPLVANASDWYQMSEFEKAYCHYDNNTAYVSIYGALYTWNAALNIDDRSMNNFSMIQGVCPTGWHMPSDTEWKELEKYLGMSRAQADTTGWRGTDEGNKLKSIDYWGSYNKGTNESGFNARPGGSRNGRGNFNNHGTFAYFWCTPDSSEGSSWGRALIEFDSSIKRESVDYFPEKFAISVRCIKDN